MWIIYEYSIDFMDYLKITTFYVIFLTLLLFKVRSKFTLEILHIFSLKINKKTANKFLDINCCQGNPCLNGGTCNGLYCNCLRKLNFQ